MNNEAVSVLHRIYNYFVNLFPYDNFNSFYELETNNDNFSTVLKRFEIKDNIHRFDDCLQFEKYCENNTIVKFDFIIINIKQFESKLYELSSNMIINKKIKFGVFIIDNTQTCIDKHIDIFKLLQQSGYKINNNFGKKYCVFYLL